MIIILGLVVLAGAVVVRVAGVLSNEGGGHALLTSARLTAPPQA